MVHQKITVEFMTFKIEYNKQIISKSNVTNDINNVAMYIRLSVYLSNTLEPPNTGLSAPFSLRKLKCLSIFRENKKACDLQSLLCSLDLTRIEKIISEVFSIIL